MRLGIENAVELHLGIEKKPKNELLVEVFHARGFLFDFDRILHIEKVLKVELLEEKLQILFEFRVWI